MSCEILPVPLVVFGKSNDRRDGLEIWNPAGAALGASFSVMRTSTLPPCAIAALTDWMELPACAAGLLFASAEPATIRARTETSHVYATVKPRTERLAPSVRADPTCAHDRFLFFSPSPPSVTAE